MSATNTIDLTQPIQPAAEIVHRSWLDRIGISASVLCAIHCLAAPFLLLLLPAAGTVWSHPAVHWVLAVLVVPLALWVLFKGYAKHRNKLTLVAASGGALLIVAGLIAPMIHTDPVVRFSVPVLLGDSSAAASPTLTTVAAPVGQAVDSTCTDTCCPTITTDAAAGTSTIAMPPGGLLTMLGSMLLVLAHTSNLIACRCFSKNACEDSACGCPASS
ncbi:MAG: MerC domain-containing protein [Planctomycetota bacterium]